MSIPTRRKIVVTDPDPTWPAQFEQIRANLITYLSAASAPYQSIEHVGSTAVAGLAAKPNIDIIIVVANAQQADQAKEALIHEAPANGHYRPLGDGGIRGRISMKLYPRDWTHDQSVYILREDDRDSMLVMRSHRALRDTLRLPQYASLRDEYGKVKRELAETSLDGVDYGQKKNWIVRKILRAAGWTDNEVDAKEALDQRTPGESDDLPY